MKKRKGIAMLMAATMCLTVLVACASNSDKGANSSTESSEIADTETDINQSETENDDEEAYGQTAASESENTETVDGTIVTDEMADATEYVLSHVNVVRVNQIDTEGNVDVTILARADAENVEGMADEKQSLEEESFDIDSFDFAALDLSDFSVEVQSETYKSNYTEYVRMVESAEIREASWTDVAAGDILVMYLDEHNNSNVIIYKDVFQEVVTE